MFKTMIKTFAMAAGLMVFSASANASIMTTTVALPNVNDYTASDSLLLWDSQNSIPGFIESIDLSLTWKDQGWGNHKGRIFYQIADETPVFLGGATHSWVTETLSASGLTSPLDSSLKLFYTVGGGGGHSLHIRNASVTITSVPEPSTIALMGLGLVGFAFAHKRRSARREMQAA